VTRAILSVLDLAPIAQGSNASEALAHSVDVAQVAERLGYNRVWVAEHHNMPGIASSSPPVLMAHLAAHTSSIRIGAGGVMLPNHSPLVVAEQFGMLEAMHPGRIDLALGRAPGTDGVTAAALRRGPMSVEDEFPEMLRDLLAYFDGTHPRITAVPGKGYQPQMWMLGSSTYGAQVAGMLGMPYSFAHHFSSGMTMAALNAYRHSFRPSDNLAEPYVAIGVPVICAETTEQATFIAGSSSLSFVRLRSGRPTALPSPEEAAAHEFTPMERELLQAWKAPLIMGDPTEVRAQLEDLTERTGVDEMFVTSNVHSHADRLRSFELLAKTWGLART
jgi:luciferase family oxidoreductase group 1